MTQGPTNKGDTSGKFTDPQAEQPRSRRLRAGWIATPGTLDHLARVIKPLAVGLLDELIDLAAVCPRAANTDELPSPPVEILPYGPLRRFGLWTGALERLGQELRSRRLELLHALDAQAAGLAHRLARVLNLPYVVSSFSLADARHLGAIARKASAVVAASDAIRTRLLQRHVAAPERVRVIRPGVYCAKRPTCFTQLNQSIAIVAAGSLDNFRAFRPVVESFAAMLNSGHDCSLFILGSGRAERHLRKLADSLGVRTEVTIVDRPRQGQLPGIFKAADIYISPAPARSVDMQSLLAMAAGVPVLTATDEKDPSDFLIADQTAMFFECGQTESLGRKLRLLLEERASARALAERALRYLRENHSPAAMVSELLDVYHAMLGAEDSRQKAAGSRQQQ
ncbi:MAG: glycosyltransferase family 4 protein [Phycisphaerae bacterium]